MKLFFLILIAAIAAFGQEFPAAKELDSVIEQAIANDDVPGAVVWVGHNGRVLYKKAYGKRALTPTPEPMTLDTIFDAASLTKVIATTSAIMKLFERGKIRLSDPVVDYLPTFQGGKDKSITVRHLLTHFSGLRPDVDIEPPWTGHELGIKKALIDKPVAAPGERFIYSDINFILLGEIVRKVSSKPLDLFVREEVFTPLAMKDSMFRPPASLRGRIAPTEKYRGMTAPLRGVVHDPTTRYMEGLAGHAGLFTTAEDLSHYAEMFLNGGEYKGKRIFSPLTLRKFTEPQTPPGQSVLRGLGFDIDSQYSSNRGELFPIGSFGHTGFTGTSLWMDPVTKAYVILLTNSVHPMRRAPIAPLRSRVATVAAAALGVDAPGVALTGYNETNGLTRRAVARNGVAMNGIDVLASNGFTLLKNRRIGLITNHTGLTMNGDRNIDSMLAGKVNLVALFSPEHGISGKEDHENVGDAKDPKSGLPIYSLYRGDQRRPNEEMLKKIDVLVFDIQDVGARFYTYGCTMKNAMEEASKLSIPFVVLDRPNPVTGVHVEGPMLDKEYQSFVGCFNMPLRHGMTIGELARMFHGEAKLTGQLEVVAMKGWQRGDWFDNTGLPWVDLSPNMRNLNAALLYPGVGMLEYSRNYSVGRGTDTPFEVVGAEFINGRDFAAKLNARSIPGVRVYPISFTPRDSVMKGVLLQGVRFVITDRDRFNSTRLGLELAVLLEKLYPGKIPVEKNERLIGSKKAMQAIRQLIDPRTIDINEEEAIRAFLAIRDRYLLYR